MADHAPVSIEQSKKRRRTGRWITVAFVGLVCLCVLWRILADKPAILVQTDDINAPINVKTREVPDFRYAYNTRQEREIYPVEENGWQALLTAFGPIALSQKKLTERIPWEEFPTHKDSKKWYETYYVPVCEKMGVDPTVRPTFYQRLDQYDMLMKYGVTGQESEQTERPEGDEQEQIEPIKLGWRYYEDYQVKKGVISRDEAQKAVGELQSRPWTDADSPIMAKWLEENAEQYEVIATAARQPRLSCWRIVPEFPHAVYNCLLSAVQGSQEFARMALLRAQYRIGTGDLSGALDDFETILAFSNSHLHSESAGYVEDMIGVARANWALQIRFHHNSDAPFDPELSARYIALVRQYTSDALINDACENALTWERAASSSLLCDILRARRTPSCSVIGMLEELADERGGSSSKPEGRKSAPDYALSLNPVNDSKVMQRHQEILSMLESGINVDEAFKSGRKLGRVSESLVKITTGLTCPAFEAAHEAHDRFVIVAHMSVVIEALLAYQEEHGTLPPAFSVDAQGQPLHSWRVLILPYLGEEECALYEQIRLDEPWDSEYNSQFFAQMPTVYRGNVSSDMASDVTHFTVLLGEEQFFDDSGVGKDWRGMMKREDYNTAEQGMVFERKDPICWMQPDAELHVADLVAEFPEEHTVSERSDDAALESITAALRLHSRDSGFQCGRAVGGSRFVFTTIRLDHLDEILRGRPHLDEE